jgi:hypothetical protein
MHDPSISLTAPVLPLRDVNPKHRTSRHRSEPHPFPIASIFLAPLHPPVKLYFLPFLYSNRGKPRLASGAIIPQEDEETGRAIEKAATAVGKALVARPEVRVEIIALSWEVANELGANRP